MVAHAINPSTLEADLKSLICLPSKFHDSQDFKKKKKNLARVTKCEDLHQQKTKQTKKLNNKKIKEPTTPKTKNTLNK